MTGHVVVVGHGNALRCDDGLGWHAAELLADDPRVEGVEVLQRHQLTPELALDISTASLVVLVDASSRLPPGEFSVESVERVELADGVGSRGSHHFTPETLVALAQELCGRAAEMLVVSCGVQSLEIGDRLSPVVEAALPKLVDTVAEVVAAHATAG